MRPIIYQLLPRTFANFNASRVPNGSKAQNGCGTFNAINTAAIRAIKSLNVTHIWYTGIIRHAMQEFNTPAIVKGKAGSPYAITDYYDVSPDLAEDPQKRMEEFEALVERTHKEGLKVVIDFVPNHVAREYKSSCKPARTRDIGADDHPEWAFSPLNDFYYIPNETLSPSFEIGKYKETPAKVTGNDCFHAHPSATDWYDTVKLNYGVHYLGGMEEQFDPMPKLWDKMTNILLFWAKKGIDAFRCDMVGMVPLAFWYYAIKKVKKKFPKIEFIGELYEPNRYKSFIDAGFDYLYDKVGMYDYLRNVITRNYSTMGITQQWMGIHEEIRQKMLYFLENHDEQRFASGFFCGDAGYAEPAMLIIAALGQNPLLVYAGQELGEKGMDAEGFSGVDGRSSIFDYWGIASLQAWANGGKWDGKQLTATQKAVRQLYQKILNIAQTNKAITDGRLYDLQYAQHHNYNQNKQFAFLRKHKKEILLVAVNFDDKEAQIEITIPQDAFVYLEMEEVAKITFEDLLRGGKIAASLTIDKPISLTLKAWTGVALYAKK